MAIWDGWGIIIIGCPGPTAPIIWGWNWAGACSDP